MKLKIISLAGSLHGRNGSKEQIESGRILFVG